MLARIEVLNVERHQASALSLEQCPRSRSEVLQAGPDCKNHIRLGGELVGRRRARHADGPHVERMTRGERRFAGLRLAKGHAMLLAEGLEILLRLGVPDPSSGDREWFACVRQGGGACGYLALIGAHTPRQPQTILEKARGILECLRLHILTQCEGHGAAVRRVSEYVDAAIERRD